jgi:hypothetical protein
VHDGRVLVEMLQSAALPGSLYYPNDWLSQRSAFFDHFNVLPIEGNDFVKLAAVYKQLNAPLGRLSMASLDYATRAINADDLTYADYLATIASLTNDRDALALQIKAALDAAAFKNQRIQNQDAANLSMQAHILINRAERLVGGLHGF